MKIVRLVTALLLLSGASAHASLRAFPLNLPFTTSSDPLAIATDGSGYLVVWTKALTGGGTQVYGARVDAQGRLVGPAGFAISPVGGSEPAVAFDGTRYLVTWGSATGIFASRVTTQGVVLDPAGLAIRRPQNQAGTIHYASLGKTHVAFNGQTFLATWWASRTGDTGTPPVAGVWAARVSTTGAVLDDPPIEVFTAFGNYHGSGWPTFNVAAAPSGFLVVYNMIWSSGLTFGSAKVAANGTVTTGGSGLSNDQQVAAPAVVFDGTRDHIVYGFAPHVGWPPAARIWDVVDGSGTTNNLFAAQYQAGTGPAAAYDGRSLLVAWVGTTGAIEAARVWTNGTALDPAGITVTSSSASGLAAASNGTSFILVWAGGGAIVVDDITAPTVFVPGTKIVKTILLNGTTVQYSASAYDAVAGSLTPTCTPASGSRFYIGTTIVNCTATDWAGNVGKASFAVVVKLGWPP